jgi:hypothetical protein
MERLSDRFTLWGLRSIATAVLFAGVSMLLAAVPAGSMLTEYAVVRTIAGIFLQIAVVFIVLGAAASYLSRPRGSKLPNERQATPEVTRPALGGWLIGLAIALVALPTWLVIRLQTFFEEWARALGFIATWDIWNGGDAGLSGLVLMPIFAALTPPLFELIAAGWFVVTSATLLVLLLSRSPRFPRVYLVCLVLSAALVIASVRAATAAAVAGSTAEQLIQDASASAEERAQLTDGVQRYTSVVGSTAPVLMWTLCGYLIWMPSLLVSRRATTTFAMNTEPRILEPVGPGHLEAITSPPSFRG